MKKYTEMMMGRYGAVLSVGIGVLVGLMGLMGLMSACEKEVAGGNSAKVALVFAINYGDYDAEEVAMRGAGGSETVAMRGAGGLETVAMRGAGEPETVVIPVKDDIYLSATLKPERGGELRAALVDGQKVCLAAFKSTNTSTPVVTARYTADATGKLIPDPTDSNSPLGVEPGAYRFVAYSYYNNVPDAYPTVTGDLNPADRDLMWGKVDMTVPDTYEGRVVDITMGHLFSMATVRVGVDITNGKITELTGVEVSGGKVAPLSLYAGTFTGGSNQVQGLTWSTATYPATEVESDSRRVSPVTGRARVVIGNMKIAVTGETPPYVFSNVPVEFKTPLAAGTKYTLTMLFKRTRWAGSNIYWDGGKLTFDVSSSTSTYQGVYFKWGSLVGISPYGGTVANVRLYIPNVGAGTWDDTKTIGTSTWGTYPRIPVVTATSTVLNDNYLYDHPDFSNYLGDICSYLTGGVWRLPNAAEFGNTNPNSEGGVVPNTTYVYDFGHTGGVSSWEAGLGPYTEGITYDSPYGFVFFPSAELRSTSGIAGQYGGSFGNYWIGSASKRTGGTQVDGVARGYGGGIGFEWNGDATVGSGDTQWGFSARCIKN